MIPKGSRLKRVRFIEQYVEKVKERKIPLGACCMCGSVSLAVSGLRENHDIDFICTRELAEDRGYKGDHTYFFGENRRVALIPTTSPDFPEAFHGMTFLRGHHEVVDGLKVATLEDSYLFKCVGLFNALEGSDAKEKDAEDIRLMNQHFEQNGFDKTVLPEEIWDGGEVWKIGPVVVRLPSPYRLRAYSPMRSKSEEVGSCVS